MASNEKAYEKIIISLYKQFTGGNYDDWECGNTMGLYVQDPWKCRELFNRFARLQRQKKQKAQK